MISQVDKAADNTPQPQNQHPAAKWGFVDKTSLWIIDIVGHASLQKFHMNNEIFI